MTEAAVGEVVVSFRQTSVGAMSGVFPQDAAGKEYKAEVFTSGRYDYCDPDDPSKTSLTDGGLYKFPEGNTVHVTEVHGNVSGGTMVISVQDRGGTNPVVIQASTSADGTRIDFHPAVPVLPGQELEVTTSGAGSIDVFAVKATQHR